MIYKAVVVKVSFYSSNSSDH